MLDQRNATYSGFSLVEFRVALAFSASAIFSSSTFFVRALGSKWPTMTPL